MIIYIWFICFDHVHLAFLIMYTRCDIIMFQFAPIGNTGVHTVIENALGALHVITSGSAHPVHTCTMETAVRIPAQMVALMTVVTKVLATAVHAKMASMDHDVNILACNVGMEIVPEMEGVTLGALMGITESTATRSAQRIARTGNVIRMLGIV